MLPSAPRSDTLAGICDRHVHVLDPQRFPYAADRTYTPAIDPFHTVDNRAVLTAISRAAGSSQNLRRAGDIAILTASDWMRLMPFAQIATRIGGGITVTVVLAVGAIWGR